MQQAVTMPFGWVAEEGVDYAREQVAKLLAHLTKRSFLHRALLNQITLLLRVYLKCIKIKVTTL
jgi:hypothetical protein